MPLQAIARAGAVGGGNFQSENNLVRIAGAASPVPLASNHRQHFREGTAMTLRRRQFLHLAAGAAAVPAASRIARAQLYPTRPVRIVVGFAAGGGFDVTARLISQSLSERLDQQFVVENRTGANGNIATEVVVRSPSDGYTLLMIEPTNILNMLLYDKKLSFNFIRDIAPVAGVINQPYVMWVNPS
jgi:tripartite-type tricarboxylate transporter receptor subunit TctC